MITEHLLSNLPRPAVSPPMIFIYFIIFLFFQLSGFFKEFFLLIDFKSVFFLYCFIYYYFKSIFVYQVVSHSST